MRDHRRLYPTIREEIMLKLWKENPTISRDDLEKKVNEEVKRQIESLFRRK